MSRRLDCVYVRQQQQLRRRQHVTRRIPILRACAYVFAHIRVVRMLTENPRRRKNTRRYFVNEIVWTMSCSTGMAKFYCTLWPTYASVHQYVAIVFDIVFNITLPQCGLQLKAQRLAAVIQCIILTPVFKHRRFPTLQPMSFT